MQSHMQRPYLIASELTMEWSLLQHSFHCSASALLLLQYRVDHRDAAVGRLVLLPPQCIDACGCNPRLSSPAAVKTKGTVSHPSCPQVSTARIGANIAASLAISISKCSQKKKTEHFVAQKHTTGLNTLVSHWERVNRSPSVFPFK
jgi:hypothetical protein